MQTNASQFRVILVTAPSSEIADKIAAGLVERKFAACVNVVAGVTSHYVWEGKQRKEAEHLLIIKTRAGLVGDVIGFVKENHPATVPEVIALSLTSGEKSYMEWLAANTLFVKAEDLKLPY